MKDIIVTSTSEIPGKSIKEILGVVRGNTVRSRNIGVDIAAGFKNMIGGEIKSYTDMATQARDEAFNRMINAAINLSADAIVNVRFMTSTVMANTSEMLAYGTAVKLK